MDRINVFYDGLTKLMEYVGTYQVYNDWVRLVQYTKSMRRYGMAANYIQLKYNDQNKGTTMYINGRPKAVGNISRFINSTRLATTNKQPNCIFEGHEGNNVFVCDIKSIAAREELIIDYNSNRKDTNFAIMGVICILFFPTRKQCLLYVMIGIYYKILSCIM